MTLFILGMLACVYLIGLGISGAFIISLAGGDTRALFIGLLGCLLWPVFWLLNTIRNLFR